MRKLLLNQHNRTKEFRQLSLFFALLLLPMGVWGQTEYGLTVGGVEVTSANAENIIGDNIQGTVSFNPSTNTLTLDGATISGTTISNGCIVSGLSSLNIVLKGNSTLDCSNDSCTAIRSVANAALTITKGEDECSLGFYGSRAIRDFKSVTLSGMVWDRTCAYQLATINNNGEHTGMVLYDTVSNEIGEINLLDVENLPHPSMYPSYNQQNEPTFGFEGDPSWEIRYSIDYVDESLADVTNALYDMQGENVPLEGAATVTAWTVFGDATSDEVKGKLFDLSETSLSTVYGTAETLSAPTLRPAIDPEDKITVSYIGREQSDVATINASTGEVTILGPGSETFNVDFSIDDGCTVLNYEDLTFDVTVQDGYPLTINNTQVTEENRLDVLGDGGSVQFDSKNTLILNNAWISSVILGADDSWVKKGLTIYLKGDNNNIGEQEQDGLIYQGQGANVPLTFATGDVEPGTLTLSYSDQPLYCFNTTYQNNLIETLNPENHTMIIAVSMKPFVTYNEEEKAVDGGGVGLGQDIEEATTTQLTDGVLVNKILYTLPDEYDGYLSEDGNKLVALNSSMTDADANRIMAAITDGSLLPGTPDFAAEFHGMTFLLPAGNGNIVLEVNTNEHGELHVKVGDNEPVVITGTTGFEEVTIPYALTEESYVLLYSVVGAAGARTDDMHRAPGKKMMNTTTLKKVGVSARSVCSTPQPPLSPKTLTKDGYLLGHGIFVHSLESANIVVDDADIVAMDDDVFENLCTGYPELTYVDLSGTGITGITVDRTKAPFKDLPSATFIYLPVGNKIKDGEKNVIIGGVCEDVTLYDDNPFEIPKDFTATKIRLDRDFSGVLGKKCSIMLPFELDEETAASIGTFYEIADAVLYENKVYMETVDKTKANWPYMFKPAKESISLEMVDVKAVTKVPEYTVSGLTFVGCLENESIKSDNSQFFYCFKDDTFAWVYDNPVTVNIFRAYMKASGGASSNTLAIDWGDGTTSIKNMKVGSDDNIYYDLQGRRVLYPQKGVYILNGKKVVIK